MNYYIFAMILTVVIITAFTTITINALGQTSNSTLQEGQIFNKLENQQQSEQQDEELDKEIIKVSSMEFNQLLDELKDSINLLEGKNYDAAKSKLGLAIIEILNSTQQYQELVHFAASPYKNKIQQQQFNEQQQQFNDEKKKLKNKDN